MPGRISLPILVLLLLVLVTSPRAAEAPYIDNQDGTISDTAHGLMWQQSDDGVQRSWSEAISYCQSLALGGHRDWTLPKAYQLEGLIETAYSPAINPIFSVKASYYWTATTSTTDASTAKYVNFFYGNSYTYSTGTPYYVLCVREAKATAGGQLAAVFAGVASRGKPLSIHFTPTITGGKAPYFYDWDFGDGATSSGADPTHAFAQEGQFKVVLTVTDNEGAVAVASRDISLPLPDLAADKPAPPQAVAGESGRRPPEGAEGRNKAQATPSTKAASGSQAIMDVLASGTGSPYKEGALGHSLLAYSVATFLNSEAEAAAKTPASAAGLETHLAQAITSLSRGQQTPTITRSGEDFPLCATKGSTYVLAIGVSRDTDGGALAAAQDAEFVRKSIEKRCQNTRTLMLQGERANRQDVVQGLAQIGSMLTADDTLILYLGAPSGTDGGRLNWYVNDSTKDLPWFTGIYHDDLLQWAKALPVRSVLFLGEKN